MNPLYKLSVKDFKRRKKSVRFSRYWTFGDLHSSFDRSLCLPLFYGLRNNPYTVVILKNPLFLVFGFWHLLRENDVAKLAPNFVLSNLRYVNKSL